MKQCVGKLLFLLALASPVLAQEAIPGSGEVAGNFGLNNLDGIDGKKHIDFGFSGAANLTKNLAVGGEYNYQPLGSLTIAGVTGSEDLQRFGGFLRYAPIDLERVVPYLLVGGGFARLHAVASEQNLSASADQDGASIGLGAGASIYAGQSWGVRPEFRYEREQYGATTVEGDPIPAFGKNVAQFSVAAFFQFGGKTKSKK